MANTLAYFAGTASTKNEVYHEISTRHLLEDSLPPEPFQTVDLQLRVPDVLQALRGDVDLLKEVNDLVEYLKNDLSANLMLTLAP